MHIHLASERATSYTSGITILLWSAGPQSFLSEDSVLPWQENLTDEPEGQSVVAVYVTKSQYCIIKTGSAVILIMLLSCFSNIHLYTL